MKKTVRRGPISQESPEIALEGLLRTELHAFALKAGLEVLGAMFESEREAVCGPRYRHIEGRKAYRAAHAPGDLVLGGRRVRLSRPRAREVGGREVVLPSWRAFTAEDPLGERAYEQMLLGVATRGYGRSLEAVPEGLEGRGESKSAVSRRLVAATRAQLEEFLSKPLEGVDLKVLMLVGLHFGAGHRRRWPQVADGATENAATCLALLASLGERGLRAERSLLVVVDGSKALPKAVREVFGGRALVQRCQVHKKGNVLDHLPKGMRGQISASLSRAYHGRDPERARRLLMGLARKLEADYPGAAASLREGLGETLTVMGMGLPVSLERPLSSTNVIENLLGTVRGVSRRVKRWRGGGMILRWMAEGLMEAGKGFRRVRAYQGMARLSPALERNDERIDGKLKVEEAA